MDGNSDDPREGRISTDRETIRRWADEHRAIPVRRAAADDEPERFRVVRESDVEESHERVEWDVFFDRLEEGDHVVVYHGDEASHPFEVARHDEVVSRSSLDQEELEERLIEGETVTSKITETTVVESVIVEEATVESELVGSEILDQRAVDVELLERECTGCSLVDEGERDHREWFDENRYFDSIGGATSGRADAESEQAGSDAPAAGTEMSEIASTDPVPYYAELDVEEAWSVTREYVERFTVESRVESTEVAETDTVEGRDIDVEGLHQSIARSDLLDVDLTSDEVLRECDIQTEFTEDDRIRTHFDRERVVEDEVADRKRLRADVSGGDLLGMETVHTREIATEITDGVDEAATGATGVGAGEGTDRAHLTDDEIGKAVFDATGEEVGMVTDVDEGAEVMYVDPHPGITDRIKAALDWGNSDGDDYPVELEQIDRITGDRVELRGAEELDESERTR